MSDLLGQTGVGGSDVAGSAAIRAIVGNKDPSKFHTLIIIFRVGVRVFNFCF